MMKQIVAVLGAAFFTTSLAYAQATAPMTPAKPMAPATPMATAAAGSASGCEAKAVSKAGKPLSGAAKTSFMKKCEGGEAPAAACETKAVGKNGKPLAGAAKTSFMKKCESDAAK